MSKWVRYERGLLNGRAIVFNKFEFFVGSMDHIGLGIEFGIMDRYFLVEVLKWYVGIEVYHAG